MQRNLKWLPTLLIPTTLALSTWAAPIIHAQAPTSSTARTPTWLKLASGLTLGAWAITHAQAGLSSTSPTPLLPSPLPLDTTRMPYDRLRGTTAVATQACTNDPNTFAINIDSTVLDTSDIQLVVNRATNTIDLSGTWSNPQGDILEAENVQLSYPSDSLLTPGGCLGQEDDPASRLNMLKLSGTLKLNNRACRVLQIVEGGFQMGIGYNLRNSNYGAFAHFSCQFNDRQDASEGKLYLDLSEDPCEGIYEDGYERGTQEGYERGYAEGRESGYQSGREEGYQNGYEDGREDGCDPAML
ncbi:MAG: hypothetical protein OXT67_01450 [Zetaproteobacteria bacterium]|nr:hypothetical protein [Zetaproteobacteria bacterium]